MLEIAGGIILGFVGLGVLGMLLSIDWGSSSPAESAPIKDWRDMSLDDWLPILPLAGLFAFILVWTGLGWWLRW